MFGVNAAGIISAAQRNWYIPVLRRGLHADNNIFINFELELDKFDCEIESPLFLSRCTRHYSF